MMRLGLSSAAAPDASLDDLINFARRRGLAALELCEGDGHGVAPGAQTLAGITAAEAVRAAGLTLTGYRTDRLEDDHRLARLSRALDAPVLLAGPARLTTRVACAKRILEAGGRVVIVLGGDSAARDGMVCHDAGLALGWEADPRLGPVGDMAAPLLERVGDGLDHIRLIGGGPEVAMHGGAGIGDLMRRLALTSYAGTVLLAPRPPRDAVAWEQWLGRRKGWGCGSAAGAARTPGLLDRPLMTGTQA